MIFLIYWIPHQAYSLISMWQSSPSHVFFTSQGFSSITSAYIKVNYLFPTFKLQAFPILLTLNPVYYLTYRMAHSSAVSYSAYFPLHSPYFPVLLSWTNSISLSLFRVMIAPQTGTSASSCLRQAIHYDQTRISSGRYSLIFVMNSISSSASSSLLEGVSR